MRAVCWHGCYSGTRRDLFAAASNAHPAKMAVGLCYRIFERGRAMLTEDLGEQMTMDGGTVKIRRERKSFFKRLHERKRPDLAVDFEDVMFFRRES